MSVIKTTAFVSDTIALLFHKHSSLFCHHVTYITEIVPDTDILVVDTKTQAYCLYVSVKDYKKGFRH